MLGFCQKLNFWTKIWLFEQCERLGWIATGGGRDQREELHHTSFFVVCLTVSEIDRIQSIIVGSFRKTNHCTNGLVLEPKAIQLRMSEPSGNSGRLGICAVNCKEKYKKKGVLNRKNTVKRTVFENHRKSLIQHCERSELRLHLEWTKVN